MKSKDGSNGNFLMRWILANASVGFVVWSMFFVISPAFSWMAQFGVVAIMGVLFAVMQFLVIPKKWLVHPGRWFAGTVAGWLIGSFLLTTAAIDFGISNMFTLFLLYYLPAALIQSRLFNNRFKKTWLWILAIASASVIDAALSTRFLFNSIPMQVTAQTIIPALYALITGTVLIFMSKSTKQDENLLSAGRYEQGLNNLQDQVDSELESRKSGQSQSIYYGRK